MLKRGGLRAHVNATNTAGVSAMQMLCEWSELVEISFLEPVRTMIESSKVEVTMAIGHNLGDEVETAAMVAQRAQVDRRLKWQREFEDCVRLLLKVRFQKIRHFSKKWSQNTKIRDLNQNFCRVLGVDLIYERLKKFKLPF